MQLDNCYSTGNPIVDEVNKIRITGNIIPQTWYKTIVKETGKPNLNAIIVLSDIVYWYKATEIRDEATGQIIGFKKRFKADLLQRSYQQISDQFGFSKRDATNAVVALEKLGVIKRVFRNMKYNGMILNNILYLELSADVLKKITFPYETEEDMKVINQMGGATKKSDRVFEEDKLSVNSSNGQYLQELGTGITEKGERVFQEKKISITEKSDSIYPERVMNITQKGDRVSLENERGVTEKSWTNTKITTKNTNKEYNNPIQSYQHVLENFKTQIDYEVIKHDNQFDVERLDELVNTAVDILTSNCETIRINKDEKPIALVKANYMKLNMFHIQYVLKCLSECESKARNIRAVMITSLYNSVNSIGNYYTNLYNCIENEKYGKIKQNSIDSSLKQLNVTCK